jgi:Holliday junction resolvase
MNSNKLEYKNERRVAKIFMRSGFTILQNAEVKGNVSSYEVDVYAIRGGLRVICEVKKSIRRPAELIKTLSFRKQNIRPDLFFLICYDKFDVELKEKFMKENIILLSSTELEREAEKIAV